LVGVVSDWSKEQFLQVFTGGKDPSGGQMPAGGTGYGRGCRANRVNLTCPLQFCVHPEK
jgi:hypothetical protein